MARYIDANRLISKIHELYVQPNIELWQVLKCVGNSPTADVAPKSEVEKEIKNWQELYADTVRKWEKAYEELEIKFENAKADVAREIFAEIERKVKASIVVHLEEINKEHIQDTPLYDRHSGIIFALRGMEDFIAELKKKYTEGESNGSEQ